MPGRSVSLSLIACAALSACGRVGFERVQQDGGIARDGAPCVDADLDARCAPDDVDDTNPNRWLATSSCVDADGDGSYTDCDAYETVTGPDCDDTDATQSIGCGPWWDTTFTRRVRLSFDQRAQAETLSGFPVLVRLDDTRIDYDGVVRPDGADLRFIDADGTTVLPHDLVVWTPFGESFIWVRVPEITGGSATDFIWMYYGNDTAADTSDGAAVFSNAFEGVWYFEADGTDNGGTDTTGTFPLPIPDDSAAGVGVIGAARIFSPGNYMHLRDDIDTLQGVPGFTISAWVQPNAFPDEEMAILSLSVGGTISTTNSRAFIALRDTGDIRGGGRSDDDGALGARNTTTGLIVPGANNWYHVTAVVEYGTDTLRLYLNGQQQADDNDTVAYESAATPSTATHNNRIGTEDNAAFFDFNGRIDELRLSNVPRSLGWVQTEYRSTSDMLIVFGSEELL